MELMQNLWLSFHFLRPWAWLALLPLLGLLFQIKQGQQVWGAWKKICSPELLSYLQVGSGAVKQRKMPIWIMAWVGLCLVVALAGPVWEKLPQPVYQTNAALVVVLDLSLSMNAQDVKLSRLIRAKQKLTDLLRIHREGQTALIVFAGTAHVVTPLTDDVATILSQLRELSTDIMPKQGGHIDAGLLKAMALFQQTSVAHGVVLLMTDSNQYSDAVVKQLVQTGHRLDVIGIGTQEGAPIPKVSGGFLTNRQGNIVMPTLDETTLKALALLGHGEYHAISLQQDDVNPVLKQLEPSAWQHGKVAQQRQVYDTWYEEGPWLVLLVMPFVLMGFRRGVLVVVLVAGLYSSPLQAVEWGNMWQTPQAQGEALMQDKKYAQAGKRLERDDWKLSAHYRQGDYASAIKDFKHLKKPRADDVYNYGNALAHAGKLDAAIAAYKQALKMNPSLHDAEANKALLEKLKKKQQQKKKKSSKEGEKGQQSDKKSDKPSKKDASKQNGDKGSKAQQKQGQSQKKKTDQAKQASQAKQSPNHKPSKQQSESHPQQDDKKPAKQDKKSQHALSKDDLKKLEKKQAFEQTIRRIPDDPGGLLRRKFMYQYQQQHQQSSSKEGDVAW